MIRFLTAATMLFSFAACTAPPEGVRPVTGFDATRYLGTWYEIMRLDHRFERGLTRVSATYVARDDGAISVLNRGFDAERCRWKEAKGRAVFRAGRDVGSLSVTFFWPFAGGYHVVELDQEGYQWALVAGPSRSYLWILARRPDLDPAIRARLVDTAGRLGFPVEDLILVDHGETACAPHP